MADDQETSEQRLPELPCCISHEFFRVASTNPEKTAVVHAKGGSRLCRELRDLREGGSGTENEDQLLRSSRDPSSSHPTLYHGDICFSYGDIMAAVDSLSCRIRHVLGGGDDSNLAQPIGYSYSKNGHFQSLPADKTCRMPHIVGVNIGPSVEYIISVLAVLRCGEAFLPLDPLWPRDRINSIASSSGASLVILLKPCSHINVASSQYMTADWIVDECNLSVLYFSMEEKHEYASFPTVNWPCEDKAPRLFCYLMYTSGSTGKPKGVCGTEIGLVNRYAWMQNLYPLQESDTLLFKTPTSFIDHIQEFLCGICTCTPIVIPPFAELKENPFFLIDHLKAYHISRLVTIPSLMRVMIPVIRRLKLKSLQKSINLIVLSGEPLPVSLWHSLHEILPHTTILNLYGTTEISGDCMYFDCKELSRMTETDSLDTVPIGIPIQHCDIILHFEDKTHNEGEFSYKKEGELCVGGSCLFAGYISELQRVSNMDYSKQLFFRTGDFVRRLQSGNCIFLGRKDRTIKVNGHRVALEEIESVLREHTDVDAVAVTSIRNATNSPDIHAYIVLKLKNTSNERSSDFDFSNKKKAYFGMNEDEEASSANLNEQLAVADVSNQELILSIRSWMLKKLPLAMIPSRYTCIPSLPLSHTGKVDYTTLEGLACVEKTTVHDNARDKHLQRDLQVIQMAFCEALSVEDIAEEEDFFHMGGTSISAAQVAHNLGIDMRTLYLHPTPYGLLSALYSEASNDASFNLKNTYRKRRKIVEFNKDQPAAPDNSDLNYTNSHTGRAFGLTSCPKHLSVTHSDVWSCVYPLEWMFSVSRCNHYKASGSDLSILHNRRITSGVLMREYGVLQQLWKVNLKSCVDASPLLILRDGRLFLYIGSHAHLFLCVEAISGSVQWEVELEGRVECSAIVTDDFSQVVVGCYQGKIYFIDCLTGTTTWLFQTDGEVKMQPVVWNNVVWCGSYDHFLYALDWRKKCCQCKIYCGGSIYGSPSVDTVNCVLCVAATSGRVTAISLKVAPFSVIWIYEAGVPCFGSPCLEPSTRNVICCFVDGSVRALSNNGSVIWKAMTDGPIFAGACIDSTLSSQVLVCSRSGCVYSFEPGGRLLWEYQIGEPITASAYIDEQVELTSDPSAPPDRLACICGSSGSIHVIKIISNPSHCTDNKGSRDTSSAQKFACIKLSGDIFSSPVMIDGRIFVGCRDDHLYSLELVLKS